MKTTMTKRLARAALIAGLALPTAALLPGTGPIAALQAQAATAADFKGVLVNYGSFVNHAKYGEVWVPSVTPQGWHPYPPCHWVNTKKYGWYFQDNTPWGAIVHHYGRWAHDAQMGWIWVPGEQWSPGWVVWRTSDQWVGWVPMLPDQDVKTISADEFNNDKMWIFMEVEKFGKSCAGDTVVAAAQYPTIFAATRYVTEIAFIDGIVIFVLPPYLYGPIVDIVIDIDVWSPTYIFIVVNNWNWIWNNININIACTFPVAPYKHNPPPTRTHLLPPPLGSNNNGNPPTRINLPQSPSGPSGPSGLPIRNYDPPPRLQLPPKGSIGQGGQTSNPPLPPRTGGNGKNLNGPNLQLGDPSRKGGAGSRTGVKGAGTLSHKSVSSNQTSLR